MNTTINTTNITNHVQNINTPADIGAVSNQYSGGVIGIGIIISVWFVIFYGLVRRGYRVQTGMVASTFVASISSGLLLPTGIIGSEIPLITLTGFGISLFYSLVSK